MTGKDNWFSRTNPELKDADEVDEDIIREFRLLQTEQHEAMFHAFTEGLFTGLGKKKVEPLDGNVCITASCAWSSLSSIGLCTRARNVTSNLVIEEEQDGSFIARLPPFEEAYLRMPNSTPISTFNITTPSILNLDGYPMHSSLRTVGPDNGTSPWPPVWASSGFEYGPDTDILNTTISQNIFMYDNREHANYTASVRAVEMLTHFCVHTYNVSVEGGVSKTELIKTFTKIASVEYAFEDDGYMFLEDEDGNTTSLIKWPIPDATFSASLDRVDVLSYGMLTGIFRGVIQPYISPDAPDFMPYNESEVEATTFANIERMGKNIAMTMSNTLRGYGDLVGGTPYLTVTHIMIQLEGLALLAAQILLTISFLATMIVHTAILGVDVVKSSEVASLMSISQVGHTSASSQRSDTILQHGLQTSIDRKVIGTLRLREGRWAVELSEDHTPTKSSFQAPWRKKSIK